MWSNRSDGSSDRWQLPNAAICDGHALVSQIRSIRVTVIIPISNFILSDQMSSTQSVAITEIFHLGQRNNARQRLRRSMIHNYHLPLPINASKLKIISMYGVEAVHCSCSGCAAQLIHNPSDSDAFSFLAMIVSINCLV